MESEILEIDGISCRFLGPNEIVERGDYVYKISFDIINKGIPQWHDYFKVNDSIGKKAGTRKKYKFLRKISKPISTFEDYQNDLALEDYHGNSTT